MLNGQWVGPYTGTNSGVAVVELDDCGDNYEGVVFAFDDNSALPSVLAYVDTIDKNTKFSKKIVLQVLHPETWERVPHEQVKLLFPGTTLSMIADSDWELTSAGLRISWKTPQGTFGEGTLHHGMAASPSDWKAETISNWSEFKKFVETLEPYKCVFRGQENSQWRLRTHFHRTGRAFLQKFISQDIPALHKNIVGMTRSQFDRKDPDVNGAFFSLVQHHGYPTPLLDWTYSRRYFL